MAKPRGRSVTVIGIDPGTTTGLCIVSVDKSWLRGAGEPTWSGLGVAIRSKTAYQVGRYPKTFEVDSGRSTRLDTETVNEHMLPILAEQPLEEEDGMRSTERFQAILDGRHVAGGDDLLFGDALEVTQIRQVSGLLYNYEESAVVCEDFSLRTDSADRDTLSPDRLRLALQAEEILHGAGRVFFLQMPDLAKRAATDDRLKRAGLWFPGMVHATDAARHVAAFLRRARQHEEIRAAAWPAHFASNFDE